MTSQSGGAQVREREDGQFAVRTSARACWVVLTGPQYALWRRVQQNGGDVVAALHDSPDADFRDWIDIGRRLNASQPMRALMSWTLPLPTLACRAMLLLCLVAGAVAAAALFVHRDAVFADVAWLGPRCAEAWLACVIAFSAATVLTAGLLVSAGLGAQPLGLGVRGIVPSLVGDPSAVLALHRGERLLARLLELAIPLAPVAYFAARGAWDAAFFSAGAWYLALYPLAEGPSSGLLSELLGQDDLALHARHYHKRLLSPNRVAQDETALAVALSAALLWLAGVLWLISRGADEWPPVTAYTPDTPLGLVNLLVTAAAGLGSLAALLWSLISLLRFVHEALLPVLPTRRRPLPLHESRRDEVLAILRQSPLLTPLDDEELGQLLSEVQLTRYRRGDLLERAGERPSRLQIILQGEAAEVLTHASGLETPARLLAQQDWFGDAGLLPTATAPRDVRARSALTAAVLPVEGIRAALLRACGSEVELDETVTSAATLSRNPLLHGASPRTLYALARAMDRLLVDVGDLVVRQGESGDRFYLVNDGTLEVLRDDRPITRLGRGDFFGEMSLLAGVTRSASVRAVTPCVLFELSRDDFWTILGRDTEMAATIEAVAASRRRSA